MYKAQKLVETKKAGCREGGKTIKKSKIIVKLKNYPGGLKIPVLNICNKKISGNSPCVQNYWILQRLAPKNAD